MLVVAVAMRDCSAMVGARPELAALEVEVAELELELAAEVMVVAVVATCPVARGETVAVDFALRAFVRLFTLAMTVGLGTPLATTAKAASTGEAGGDDSGSLWETSESAPPAGGTNDEGFAGAA